VVIGAYVDVAAAHDGDYVPAGETVTVFEDRRDAERGRRFDDETSVVEEHPHEPVADIAGLAMRRAA
jgi:hypothetical protein